MNRHFRYLTFFTAVILLLTSHLSHANLLIKPFRAVLDKDTRTAEITLLNSSTEIKTYNIQWEEKLQTASGGYTDVSESQFSASDFIRHSPRQVTIKPGEYQKIKLRLRMPKTLAPGEYRSHLMMKAIASLPKINDKDTKGMKVQIIPQLSFSIPIIVRNGVVNSKTEITSLNIKKDKKDKQSIAVMLSHEGDYSTYGSLYAYMKVGNQKTQQIGEAHNIAVFRESKQRQANIILQVPSIPKGAVVQVLYKGDDEFDSQILAKAAMRH